MRWLAHAIYCPDNLTTPFLRGERRAGRIFQSSAGTKAQDCPVLVSGSFSKFTRAYSMLGNGVARLLAHRNRSALRRTDATDEVPDVTAVVAIAVELNIATIVSQVVTTHGIVDSSRPPATVRDKAERAIVVVAACDCAESS